MLVGIPGTGKSIIVSAFAKKIGWNAIAYRNIRSMWVGESERNLERVNNIALSLSPVVVFIDEIDQNLGQRGQSGDSGVSQRLLARFWEFMARPDLRGKILWIGASNRPDLLDPATVDRFGVVIPFIHPTPLEVFYVFKAIINKLDRKVDITESEFKEIIENAMKRCNGMVTGRTIAEVITKAAHIADLENSEGLIKKSHIEKALSLYSPNMNVLEHEFIALLAISMTSFVDLYPWMSVNGVRRQVVDSLPFYLEGIVDKVTGNVNKEVLNKRLAELKKGLFLRRIS